MDDKIAQDYSAWFSELEFLNRLLEQRSAAPRCRSEDDEKSLRGLAREHFEQKVLPHFKRYEERGASDSVTLREQEPWLVEFGRRTGTFQKSLEMFRRQPAQLSAALSSYTEIMYCGMILLCWRMDKPSTSSQNYSYLVPTHGMVTQSIPSCVSNTEADWKLAKYALAYDHFDSSSPWRDFVSWIGDFANIIGCSAPADERKLDAFSFVNAIQKKCFETDSSARETELQATINLLTEENAKLKETVREWTRMQAVLSFRHVLERLPSPSGKKAGESASWADFWKKAVEEATKPGAKNTELARIVKDYRKLRDDIKKSTEKPSENASKTAVEKATTALANPNENSTAQTTNEVKDLNGGTKLLMAIQKSLKLIRYLQQKTLVKPPTTIPRLI